MGAMLLTEAATAGSKSAACNLGICFAGGTHGFPKNEGEARRWYSKVATGTADDLNDAYKEEAAQWLIDHPAA